MNPILSEEQRNKKKMLVLLWIRQIRYCSCHCCLLLFVVTNIPFDTYLYFLYIPILCCCYFSFYILVKVSRL